MYSRDELFLRPPEISFGVYCPRCFATRKINTKWTLSWALKKFGIRAHILFSMYLERFEPVYTSLVRFPANSMMPAIYSSVLYTIVSFQAQRLCTEATSSRGKLFWRARFDQVAFFFYWMSWCVHRTLVHAYRLMDQLGYKQRLWWDIWTIK